MIAKCNCEERREVGNSGNSSYSLRPGKSSPLTLGVIIAEENPIEPEPFLELEEETEGAPASSESTSGGPLGKDKGHGMGQGEVSHVKGEQ